MKYHEFRALSPYIGQHAQGDLDGYARVADVAWATYLPAWGWQTAMQLAMEHEWVRARRPYYRIHPSLIRPFLRTRLDIPWRHIPLMGPVVIEMGQGPNPQTKVQSLMVGVYPLAGGPGLSPRIYRLLAAARRPGDAADAKAFIVSVDCGESMPVENGVTCPNLSYYSTPADLDDTVEASMGTVDTTDHYAELLKYDSTATKVDEAVIADAMRVVTMIGLLTASGSELIVPDVLNADAAKYAKTGDVKYVEKAKRRGRNGYTVGAAAAAVPHFRPPHFAIRWRDRGRVRPVLTEIKGSIVHRTKLAALPQGRHDGEKGNGGGQ